MVVQTEGIRYVLIPYFLVPRVFTMVSVRCSLCYLLTEFPYSLEVVTRF